MVQHPIFSNRLTTLNNPPAHIHAFMAVTRVYCHTFNSSHTYVHVQCNSQSNGVACVCCDEVMERGASVHLFHFAYTGVPALCNAHDQSHKGGAAMYLIHRDSHGEITLTLAHLTQRARSLLSVPACPHTLNQQPPTSIRSLLHFFSFY